VVGCSGGVMAADCGCVHCLLPWSWVVLQPVVGRRVVGARSCSSSCARVVSRVRSSWSAARENAASGGVGLDGDEPDRSGPPALKMEGVVVALRTKCGLRTRFEIVADQLGVFDNSCLVGGL
jgi:hypothetical protein